MSDRKGDPTKQPAECNGGSTRCPNLKEVGGGFEGEVYECVVCGEYFRLYYEDMA